MMMTNRIRYALVVANCLALSAFASLAEAASPSVERPGASVTSLDSAAASSATASDAGSSHGQDEMMGAEAIGPDSTGNGSTLLMLAVSGIAAVIVISARLHRSGGKASTTRRHDDE